MISLLALFVLYICVVVKQSQNSRKAEKLQKDGENVKQASRREEEQSQVELEKNE